MSNKNMNIGSSEIESTLIICSENPMFIMDQITHLKRINNFEFTDSNSILINDYYFDTPNNDLKDLKSGLRIREIGKKCYITFKGPPHVIALKSGIKRYELELLWTPDSLNTIIDILKELNVNIKYLRPNSKIKNSLITMKQLNLNLIQKRETYRKFRYVLSTNNKDYKKLAELAIDKVIYHCECNAFNHYEIEIELKESQDPKLLHLVIEQLQNKFGTSLRIWPYSKLITGQAICDLLNTETKNRMINMRNNLTSYAYDIIDEYLKKL